MLFLPALLFFTLGISVVAIPISPVTSDISPRGAGGPETQLTIYHHGNAQVAKKPDGIWTTIQNGRIHMKVISGVIEGIWPMLEKRDAELLFTDKNWNRETSLHELYLTNPALAKEICQGYDESTRFPEGFLEAVSIVYKNSKPASIKANFGLDYSQYVPTSLGIHVPLWKE